MDSLEAAITRLESESFDALYLGPQCLSGAAEQMRVLRNECVLEGMADGVALLDSNNAITWANQQLIRWCDDRPIVGLNFYEALGDPEILGPDFCPFHTALAIGKSSCSTLRISDHRYFQVHAAPIRSSDAFAQHLVVTISDVSDEMLQKQKLEALHRAGIEIADLSPEEIGQMAVQDRIELVKSNILHYTQDLLKLDVIEVRMLDQASGELRPLVAVGMADDASGRALYAHPQGNGVTGFVAATAKSYLCEDTTEDPLYIEGFIGAKSSMTVPLLWHDQVIGTFNVESPEPRAFNEGDLQFLEIFARDVANSLNTLELLVAQQANAALESVEAIHSAVALPVDEILNDAVNVMERYIGHDPEVVDRLRRILRNARDIKRVIQKVGQRMAPSQAIPTGNAADTHRDLMGKRVLVVDADEAVRNDAHALLERYGCVIETAHDSAEAVSMVRNAASDDRYDVIISDIRLPDESGYRLMVKLQQFLDPVPMVLMTGFGYDPGHSIVKARQAGLHPKAVLYKPFRLDQLLETVETILQVRRQQPQAQASSQ